MKEYIEKVIAPKLQGDGGWIELVGQEGDTLRVRLQGECSKCNIAGRCMDWIRQEIKRDLDREVTLVPVSKKPFFWDR